MIRRSISCLVAIGLLFHSYISAKACGPSYLQPIFVFEESPDKRVLQWAKSDPSEPRIPEACLSPAKPTKVTNMVAMVGRMTRKPSKRR